MQCYQVSEKFFLNTIAAPRTTILGKDWKTCCPPATVAQHADHDGGSGGRRPCLMACFHAAEPLHPLIMFHPDSLLLLASLPLQKMGLG
jgi:hypothetical protein